MRRVLIIALLAAQALARPQADTAEEHLKAGAAYEQKHDYDRAIPELRRALELKPDSTEAEGLLGEALLARGYSSEAIPHLEHSNRLDLLGIALTEEHRTAQAIGTLLAALQKQPNDPDLLYYLGKACGFLSKSSYDRLVGLNPDSTRAHQLLGESYQAQQQFDAAEREYRKALALQPDLRGVHMALGMIRQEAGNLDAAETEFRAEARLSPGDGEAAWRLGSVLLAMGRTREALAELERSNKIRPQMVETLYDLGKAFALDNQPHEAEKVWLQVIALNDASESAASAHLRLSELYRKEGRAAEADQQLKRFRELQRGKPAP